MTLTRLSVESGGESIAVRLDRPARPKRPTRPTRPTTTGWTFLYLHGFGSRQSGEKASHFRQRARAARLPFCSFDFRGHGESQGELGATTFARQLEDVACVRRHLAAVGFDQVVLIGSSMGGATALLHAAADPGGVAACLLIAPAVGLAREVERLGESGGLEAWRRDGALRLRTELVEADLGWTFAEDARNRDFLALARALTTPTLVLQGRNDRSVDFRDVLDFAAAAPPGRLDLVLYGDGDHRLADRLDELWTRMLDFLRRRGLLPHGNEDEKPKSSI